MRRWQCPIYNGTFKTSIWSKNIQDFVVFLLFINKKCASHVHREPGNEINSLKYPEGNQLWENEGIPEHPEGDQLWENEGIPEYPEGDQLWENERICIPEYPEGDQLWENGGIPEYPEGDQL